MKGFTLALMIVVLVGVASARRRGNPNNCRYWCKDNRGHFTCCDKLPECPVDDRQPGDCSHTFFTQATFVSGPLQCADDSDCGRGAICCPDKCLGHNVCKNV